MKKFLTPFLALISLLLIYLVGATEVKYTPNEQDDGPLPLSQSQRQQLLQLEQAIAQSLDPQATLLQVAEANNMDPQDLVDMLERNRRDLAAGGDAPRQLVAWPQQVLKLLGSIGVILSQAASKNPKVFSTLTLSLLCLIYVGIMAPRTGLLVSSNSGFLSRGHTTWFLPPTRYVDRFLESHHYAEKGFSVKEKKLHLGDLELSGDDNCVQWLDKFGRTSALKVAATSRVTIRSSNYIPHGLLDGEEDTEDDAVHEFVTSIVFEQAVNILSSRRFTEFTDSMIRFQSSHDKRQRSAVLVIPSSGDWGRFGLQPLRVTHQSEDETCIDLTYSTLKGGVFDGQIQFSAKQVESGDVVLQVSILIPRKSRKLGEKLSIRLVKTLSDSIERSILTEAKKLMARQVQGKRFKEKAKSRASERRHFRFEKEKQLEEMAEDRRRRWQRTNKDTGRYRPSGHRMKSPNNC
jgi:uncharacterized protein (UPF0548 family)